jgi:signal transduction histidine kinase
VEVDEQLERFVRCADALAAHRSVEDVGRTLAEQLTDAVPAARCAVYAMSSRQGDVPRRCHGSGPPTVEPRYETVVDGHRVELPLLRSDQLVGVVCLDAQAPVDAAAVEVLELLGKLGANAIARSLSLADTVRQASIARAALQANPDPIGLFAPDGAVLLENAPMTALRAELEAGGWHAPFDDRRSPGRDELALSGERERTYARFTAPVEDEEGPLGTIVELRETTAEREAERARDRFLAMISHELRTPLTAIIGFVDLILDEEQLLEADHARAVQVIGRNARRLHRLVTDLLFVAQAEARDIQLPDARVDLSRLAAETIESAELAAREGGVELVGELEDGTVVVGDEDRLGQLLDNLTSNALKFTPAGGRVTVRVARRPTGTLVEVSDTGVGISADDQARIFEAFFRAQDAAAGHVPGVGLGLAVSRSIAELHGGAISVRSAPGEGATFRVELPPASLDG